MNVAVLSAGRDGVDRAFDMVEPEREILDRRAVLDLVDEGVAQPDDALLRGGFDYRLLDENAGRHRCRQDDAAEGRVQEIHRRPHFFSSGLLPLLRTLMNSFSVSNQNGAPIDTAMAVRIQPNRWPPARDSIDVPRGNASVGSSPLGP